VCITRHCCSQTSSVSVYCQYSFVMSSVLCRSSSRIVWGKLHLGCLRSCAQEVSSLTVQSRVVPQFRLDLCVIVFCISKKADLPNLDTTHVQHCQQMSTGTLGILNSTFVSVESYPTVE